MPESTRCLSRWVQRMGSPMHQPFLACAKTIASVDFGNLATPVQPGGCDSAAALLEIGS
jgi:hypothetical protein